MTQERTSLARQSLTIRPLTARAGAEISGIKLSGDLPQETADEIYAALLKHKVIFFRGQEQLTDGEQERFSARFGKIVPHPTQRPLAQTNGILELDSTRSGGRADSWHTDVTFVDAYPKLSILRGVVIPETGGDTIWSNTVTAYDSLPDPLKVLAETLWAVHSNAYDYAAQRPHGSDEDKRYYEEVFASVAYETEHPVVRVHPETGERTLLLGSFVQRFVGFSRADSDAIYALLQSRVLQPENTVRWNWRAGDVAIWDNRATQHYAVNDYGSARRVVRRTTLDGDVPVSVDGRRSVTRKIEERNASSRAA